VTVNIAFPLEAALFPDCFYTGEYRTLPYITVQSVILDAFVLLNKFM